MREIACLNTSVFIIFWKQQVGAQTSDRMHIFKFRLCKRSFSCDIYNSGHDGYLVLIRVLVGLCMSLAALFQACSFLNALYSSKLRWHLLYTLGW